MAGHLRQRFDATNAGSNKGDVAYDWRLDRIDARFDEIASYLRAMERRVFDHLQSVQNELGCQIDAIQRFRLQALALVVALAATSAIVGTFALQLFATF